ncbi:MAG: hypothetical protein EOO38_00275 [Cytophagaceae bacterium]|nr:MAG: hypothetical protein EOO38_00275 [Cytophagaceae bacterium]
MPQEFTIQSAPQYRSLEVVLPSARSLRAQQADLTQRRAESLRAIAQELQAAMAQGHDSCIMEFAEGWRERALTQAGYDVQRAPAHYGPSRWFIYFGDRDAAERSALIESFERPDGPSATERDAYIPRSPPSPSVYTRSVYMAPRQVTPPAPVTVPPIIQSPLAARPPFDRGHTVPGPEYRSVPQRPERGVAFEQDVRAGAYTPRPGGRF